jgi:hypothetical protein
MDIEQTYKIEFQSRMIFFMLSLHFPQFERIFCTFDSEMVRIFFLILIFALSAPNNGFAQLKALGGKGGVNYSSILLSETIKDDGIDWNYAKKEADVGLVVGFFGRAYTKNTFIQPEVILSQHRYSTRISSVNLDTIRQLNINRLDVPLLIGYSKKDRFRIMAGPIYTKQLQYSPFVDEFYSEDMKNFFRDGSWAGQVGIGFDLGGACIDLRYETNLSRFGDEVVIRGKTYKFDYRSSVIQLTLGIDFVHPEED